MFFFFGQFCWILFLPLTTRDVYCELFKRANWFYFWWVIFEFREFLFKDGSSLARVCAVYRLFCESIVVAQLYCFLFVPLEAVDQDVVIAGDFDCLSENFIAFSFLLLQGLRLCFFVSSAVEFCLRTVFFFEGELSDWFHESEILGVVLRGIVIFDEDGIAWVLVVVVFMVLFHDSQTVQQFLHWLPLKLIVVISHLVFAFVLEKLCPRYAEHGHAQDNHDDGDYCHFYSGEEEVVETGLHVRDVNWHQNGHCAQQKRNESQDGIVLEHLRRGEPSWEMGIVAGFWEFECIKSERKE